jgi:hypothetical protein
LPKRLRELLFRLFQCLFRSLALGDVLHNSGDSIDARWTLDGKVRREYVPLSHLGVLVVHLVADDFALKTLVQLWLENRPKVFFIDYFADEAAYDLFFLHAPKVEEGAIGDHVAVIPVHHRDHFLQAFYDSLVFPQPFLSLSAFGDVLDYGHVPIRTVTLRPHRHNCNLGPAERAIRTEEPFFHSVVPHLSIGELPQLLDVLHEIVGVRDALEIAAQQVLFRPPDDFAAFRIDSQEPPGPSFNPADANRGAVMNGAIAVFAGLEQCLGPFALGEVVDDGHNIIPLQLDPSHADFHGES